jgi:acyl carrier protein
MSTTTTTQQDLEGFVFDTLAEFGTDRDKISREARLEDISIDSLDLVELGQLVDERYQVRLEARDFEGVDTVGDALDVIAGKIGQ